MERVVPSADPSLAQEARVLARPLGSRALGYLLVGVIALAALWVGVKVVEVWLRPVPPALHEVAPDFFALTPGGERFELGAHRGSVVLLDFWATWCPGCVAFTPNTKRLHRDYARHGLVLVAVNQEPDAVARVRDFVVDRGIEHPVVIDPGGIARAYGIYELPSYVLIDAGGTVRARHSGMASEPQLRKEIEVLLGEPGR